MTLVSYHWLLYSKVHHDRFSKRLLDSLFIILCSVCIVMIMRKMCQDCLDEE